MSAITSPSSIYSRNILCPSISVSSNMLWNLNTGHSTKDTSGFSSQDRLTQGTMLSSTRRRCTSVTCSVFVFASPDVGKVAPFQLYDLSMYFSLRRAKRIAASSAVEAMQAFHISSAWLIFDLDKVGNVRPINRIVERLRTVQGGRVRLYGRHSSPDKPCYSSAVSRFRLAVPRSHKYGVLADHKLHKGQWCRSHHSWCMVGRCMSWVQSLPASSGMIVGEEMSLLVFET